MTDAFSLPADYASDVAAQDAAIAHLLANLRGSKQGFTNLSKRECEAVVAWIEGRMVERPQS